ncbi:retropepsin-like aspartic protease [Roseivirga sp. E12]|uniref:retropepsin-like aspartic protease n=1 Tax=Roseivirga sp. E12 TaxID=2819237 RepID=UPI001ABC159D|nr:retropepsin-like aspartic protease [Roseivirga sp. E12]MBO3697665.1 retropepsin-like domain-containing protein [Roseivirga sp. E12]
MKKLLIAIVFLFFTFGGQCQRTITSGTIIPIDMSSHRPVMDVMINGKGPYKFIFDTGSSTNVVDAGLSDALGLEVVGEDPLRTPGSKNRLMSKRVGVKNLALSGSDIIKDTEMNVIELRKLLPVDGILGGFFLEDYLVTMDYPGSQLILTKGELSATDKDVIPFVQDARNLNLQIDIMGNEVEAHLDSGNPFTITIPYSFKDKLKYKGAPKRGLPMRTPVATFESWDAQLDGEVSIGNAVFNDPRIRLSEGIEFVNLGYAVINELQITIDRKNSLIKLEKGVDGNSTTRVVMEMSTSRSPFIGTYTGDRKIFLNDSDKLMYERAGAPMALELVRVEEDLYQITVPEGVYAPQEIPKVHFIRNENNEVVEIEMVFKDGRKEGPYKRVS